MMLLTLAPRHETQAGRAIWPRLTSALAALALGACLSAMLLASPASATPVCRGKDLLPGFAESDPKLHARLLDSAQREPNSEALLWQISRANAKRSWLFGTIHLTDERVHTLSPATREALIAAKTLALEVENIAPSEMQQAIAGNPGVVALGGGRRLDQLLSAPEMASLRSIAHKVGLSPQEAAVLRPWFLTTLLSHPLCERHRQEIGLMPLDMTLRDMFMARRARVVGLETIAEQMQALASLPLETETAWLRGTLAQHAMLEDATETLVQLYLKRRLGAAWELGQALAGPWALSPEHLAQVQDALLVKRNYRMRETALPLLAEGEVFIGVGALHLPGKEGLVQLIREKGYTVTAIE